MSVQSPLSSTERSTRRRAALRAEGLKPRMMWLPDRSSDAYRKRTERDVAIINGMRHESDTMAFIEAVQYWPEEDYDWGPGGPP